MSVEGQNHLWNKVLTKLAVRTSIVLEELHKMCQIFIPQRFGIGGGGGTHWGTQDSNI
jgi:hypothetical protein